MTDSCPKCGSHEVSGLVAAFWAKLDRDGDIDWNTTDVRSESELTEDRLCQQCGHEWVLGETPT